MLENEIDQPAESPEWNAASGTEKFSAFGVGATNVHAGRTTQVWDAVVPAEATGRRIALFRCTQSVLWPR